MFYKIVCLDCRLQPNADPSCRSTDKQLLEAGAEGSSSPLDLGIVNFSQTHNFVIEIYALFRRFVETENQNPQTCSLLE